MTGLKAIFKNLCKCNSGASILTVMITVLFLSLLGSSLLYMSYMSIHIRATERSGSESFYDAVSLMEELEASFQSLSSEAISEAYSEVLTSYSDTVDKDSKFKEEFKEAVLAWRYGDTAVSEQLVETSGSRSSYNTEVLSLFLQRAGVPAGDISIDGDEATVMLGGHGSVIVEEDKIVFREISISHTNPENDYVSTVTADIVMSIPDFYNENLGGQNYSGISDHVLIAQGELSNGISSMSLGGSAYANSINLNTLTLSDSEIVSGRLTVAETINIGVSHGLNLAFGAELWAQDIVLGAGADIYIDGEAYVADDLELRGNSSKATLVGEYYGFGDSTEDPNESSSILVNVSGTGDGVGATLDFAGSDTLFLAGHSFITSTHGETVGILMGESVSVRPNQTAYLVPYRYLMNNTEGVDSLAVGSNPYVVPEGKLPSDYQDMGLSEALLWTIDGRSYRFSDYGANVMSLTYPLNGTSGRYAMYFFLEFDSVEDANRYFEDYFIVNEEELTDYFTVRDDDGSVLIPNYVSISAITGDVVTSGNYVAYSTAQNDYYLGSASDNRPSLESFKLSFENLTKTLTTGITADETVTNPYEYLIDADKVSEYGGVTEFYGESGEVIALLIVGDYTIDADTEESVSLILATGNVEIKRDFAGLVIAGGNAMINGLDKVNLSPSSAAVTEALVARSAEGAEFSSVFNGYVGSNTDSSDYYGQWALSTLVSVENWAIS